MSEEKIQIIKPYKCVECDNNTFFIGLSEQDNEKVAFCSECTNITLKDGKAIVEDKKKRTLS